MFYYRQTSNDRSDSTAAWEIDVHKHATVKEFIDFKVKCNSMEFGSIYFGPKFRTEKGFKYSNFKDMDRLLEEYGDRIIKGPIKADGGWGSITYWIELEELT